MTINSVTQWVKRVPVSRAEPACSERRSSVRINQTARAFSVLDNDFPEQGVVTWAQIDTFVEEGRRFN